MKLYALLVGINAYPTAPLSQCVQDAQKVEDYLNTLGSEFESLEIISLTDKKATKKNVQETIQSHLYKATDDDVAFFYYSGHGALEGANGIFPDEHDGALDCLVCYAEDGLEAKDFLANKEIRYLFHKMPNNPHLITAIDSCHSGDIVRSYKEEEAEENVMIKRMSGVFEGRDYEDFVFAGDETVEQQNAGGSLTVNIPFKNHVHLAACLSSESSWEDSKGGVFTRYLLKLLETTGGNLTYLDISRWAKISIADVTKMKQTPKISVQGEGKMDQYSSWLNLHPDGVSFPKAVITNNVAKGWMYSRGSMLGMKSGMEVNMKVADDHVEVVKVKEVDIEHSILDIPMNIMADLDFNKSYEGETAESTYNPLSVYINDVDINQGAVDAIREVLGQHEHVSEVSEAQADFYINVFNGMVYFSLPGAEFQPLALQIDMTKTDDIKPMLGIQVLAFTKWNHFYTLENPGKDYEKPPIKVEAKLLDGDWQDVTNGIFAVDPQENRLSNGELYQKYEMKVTNLTNAILHVGVLTLNSNMGITSKPFDQRVVELQPKGDEGDSKTFYDHKDTAVAGTTIDAYKEIYNWKNEWLCYKFIFNNFEDFTSSLQGDFLQPSLPAPLVINKLTKSAESAVTRGEGSFEEMEEKKNKWGTCITRMELRNPTYNIISGEMKDLLEDYMSNEELTPFIKELYFEDYWNGNEFEVRLKQNKGQSAEEAQRATDSTIVKLLNKIYNTIRRRRFRRQKDRPGPVVIAEGDSWFLFPKPGVRDTLDYIMREYRLLSLADAGDEIADYVKNNELIEKVLEIKPDYVLISGGGNDIIGAEIKEILIDNVQNGQKGSDFVQGEKFGAKIQALKESYLSFFSKINETASNTQIFIHGYDYVPADRPAKVIEKGWANRYMIEAGVTNASDRDMIMHHLLDIFNVMMKGLDDQFDFVHFVDQRNTVGLDEWMDEIHPNNVGYEKVAKNFLAKMHAFEA